MQWTGPLTKGPNKQPMTLGILSDLILKCQLKMINIAKYLILPTF